MSTNTAPVEETLAWEAEKRPRIALIAIAGGILTVVGNVLRTVVLNGGPAEDDGFISFGQAMQARLDGQEPEGPSLFVRQLDHIADNVPLLTLSSVLVALSGVCLGLVVVFLYRATAARTEQIGRLPLYMCLAGLTLYPIGYLLRELALWFGSIGFEDETVRTAGTARDVLQSAPIAAGQLLEFFGTFALAVGVVLVALNAMRVGLLTRFLGVLGIITGVFVSGVLSVVQADQPGIIRAFWLIAVGLVIAGRFTTPPAWETGRAEPWPTQQQLREQRDAARGERADRAERITRDDDENEGEELQKPAHARKKRKRRK